MIPSVLSRGQMDGGRGWDHPGMEPLSRTPRRPFLTCAAPGCQQPEGRGPGHLLLCLLSSSCPGSASSALPSPRSRPASAPRALL